MKDKYIGVIIGDVVNSRSKTPDLWLDKIKTIAKTHKLKKAYWQIYRGDMFQLEVPADQVLDIAIDLKAYIKEDKDVDVRMGVGVGTKDYAGKTVLESNGSAFVHAGKAFDDLQQTTLAILTPWEDFNRYWQIVLDLGLLTMDDWTPAAAQAVRAALAHPDKTQKEIAAELRKSRSSISASLARAGYNEISAMMQMFREALQDKIQQT